MKHIIVAIQDKAVQTYGRPFVARTPDEAIRTVKIEVNRAAEGNMFHTHPEDYALYKVGEWDDESGRIFGNENFIPERLIEMINLVAKPKE